MHGKEFSIGLMQELNPQLQEVVASLPKDTPPNFVEEAKNAGKIVQALDAYLPVTFPLIRKFLVPLANADYIRDVQFTAKNPEQALPFWLQDTFLKEAHLRPSKNDFIGKDGRAKAIELFDTFVTQQRYSGSGGLGSGVYYQVSNQRENIPYEKMYKVYIEHRPLLDLLNSNKLEALFGSLVEQPANLYDIKLHDGDRLVLYFSGSIDDVEETESTLTSHSIHYRGPAQDVSVLDIEEDGTITTRPVASNDMSFLQHTYEVDVYNAKDFFENYLEFCLKFNKSPINAYKRSFVSLVDRKGFQGSKKEEKVKDAERRTLYPIQYIYTGPVNNTMLPLPY